MIPRHEITERDADNPGVYPVMGTWVLSRLQMAYVYSLPLKLFATVPGIATQLSSISIAAAFGSREIQS